MSQETTQTMASFRSLITQSNLTPGITGEPARLSYMTSLVSRVRFIPLLAGGCHLNLIDWNIFIADSCVAGSIQLAQKVSFVPSPFTSGK